MRGSKGSESYVKAYELLSDRYFKFGNYVGALEYVNTSYFGQEQLKDMQGLLKSHKEQLQDDKLKEEVGQAIEISPESFTNQKSIMKRALDIVYGIDGIDENLKTRIDNYRIKLLYRHYLDDADIKSLHLAINSSQEQLICQYDGNPELSLSCYVNITKSKFTEDFKARAQEKLAELKPIAIEKLKKTYVKLAVMTKQSHSEFYGYFVTRYNDMDRAVDLLLNESLGDYWSCRGKVNKLVEYLVAPDSTFEKHSDKVNRQFFAARVGGESDLGKILGIPELKGVEERYNEVLRIGAEAAVNTDAAAAASQGVFGSRGGVSGDASEAATTADTNNSGIDGALPAGHRL